MVEQRTYRWAELSGPEVEALAKETEVALLPIGCVEMHGPHMPTGADGYEAEGMADLVAAREPAIILPPLFYNINDEMTCYPGTISMSPELMARLYEEICRQAARNGFRKIVFLIAHGGSEGVTEFVHHSFLQRRLWERDGFAAFDIRFFGVCSLDAMLETPRAKRGHGCEAETAVVQRFRPDLVHLEQLEPLPEGEGPYYPKSVGKAYYVVDWCRQVPKGYIGMPQLATPEKGRAITEAIADACARVVCQIKEWDPARDA
jgi:creatinine amidohydrolase